ncbi:MAG: HXXEE domain-containing protein [Sphingobacteriales bacterium]|nr:MAG: HXXEE domain-containing protein [Sphingobacteriales bacterium]
MKKSVLTIILAFLFTVTVLSLGYISFGFWTTLIFTSGFLGGFVLWLFIPATPSFATIKVPYWLSFALFIAHRVEEKVCGFFARLAEITGTPTPEITSVSVILLVLASVVAWLLVPFLVSRQYAFGYYLAWTFFAAMGITELAHFIFPLFTKEPYGYFPGMASVFFLAPVAWWGMYRLSRKHMI